MDESVRELLNEFFIKGEQWSWAGALILSIGVTIALKLTLKLLSSRIRRIGSHWNEIVADIFDGLRAYVVFFWTFYLMAGWTAIPAQVARYVYVIVVVLTGYQVGLWGLYLIRRWRDVELRRKISKDAAGASALSLIYLSVRAAFITAIVLIGLGSLGVDIRALLAGLGVGGIAVALAAQNILGDLLASLSIVLDKPFVVGDFIIVGSELGTVESIGIKTTRVRSLSGEQIVFSNKDLLESRIRNFKGNWRRRVVQRFGVAYSTPVEKMELIPQWVKEAVGRHSLLKFDRCNLFQYSPASMDYELIFMVEMPDYNVYMELQEKVLLDLRRKFQQEGVEFAKPIQTVYLESNAFEKLNPGKSPTAPST